MASAILQPVQDLLINMIQNSENRDYINLKNNKLTLTVITPFLPTFFIASEIRFPISRSPLAEMVATYNKKLNKYGIL